MEITLKCGYRIIKNAVCVQYNQGGWRRRSITSHPREAVNSIKVTINRETANVPADPSQRRSLSQTDAILADDGEKHEHFIRIVGGYDAMVTEKL